jgi:hypothetical protein
MRGIIDTDFEKFKVRARTVNGLMGYLKALLILEKPGLDAIKTVHESGLRSVDRPSRPSVNDEPDNGSPLEESRHVMITENTVDTTIPIEEWEAMTPEERERYGRMTTEEWTEARRRR